MNQPMFIYCLRDPHTAEVLYVGKSDNVLRRFGAHSVGKNSVGNWIRRCEVSGSAPIIHILERCPGDWRLREKFWIAFYRSSNQASLNISSGGDGHERSPLLGRKLTSEHRLALSLAKKGRLRSEKHADQLRQARLGNKGRLGQKRSPAELAKQSAKLKGRKLSPEHLAKVRLRCLEYNSRPVSEETRARMSQAARTRGGRPWTDTAKRKLSESQKAAWIRRRAIAAA